MQTSIVKAHGLNYGASVKVALLLQSLHSQSNYCTCGLVKTEFGVKTAQHITVQFKSTFFSKLNDRIGPYGSESLSYP